MTNPIRLIVGLGNPGSEYAKTRHNVGFWLIDKLADKYKVTLNMESKFFGISGKFKHNLTNDIHLIKPQTYMNLSGKSVQAIAGFYKIQPEEMLVVHDELDFDPGIVKLKLGGGHAGHNGLRDIDRVLGKNFWRLRLGIGHPGDKNKVVNYVLNKPSTDEQIQIEESITDSLKILELLFEGNFNVAMKKLHTK